MLLRVIWTLLVLIGAVLVVQSRGNPLGDYDFGTGLVRCGVAGLSTSCGSVAP